MVETVLTMLPEFLIKTLERQYGEESNRIVASYAQKRAVTLRVNSLKTDAESVKKQLKAHSIPFEEVPWFEAALVCPNSTEQELRDLEIYEKGEIYLQSLSSMLPPLVLNAEAGESVLDMTAAPGGKTTEIAALSGGKTLITACEKDKIRFDRLKYNVEKQSAPRVTLLNQDALKLDEFFRFDKILLDAPCSGSGTIQEGERIKISEKLVENCVVLQEKLLLKAWKLLKKGGTIVYSTCSVLRQENEDVLLRVIAKTGATLVPLDRFFDCELLPCLNGTLCLRPNDRFEGFFLAKLQKQ